MSQIKQESWEIITLPAGIPSHHFPHDLELRAMPPAAEKISQMHVCYKECSQQYLLR